jgi:Ca2+-binding EF-hand superfamily protein
MFIRAAAMVLLFFGLFTLFSTSGLAQGGKKGGGKDFKKGDKGAMFTPEDFFKKLANGKDYISVADLENPKWKEPLEAFAKKEGITNGKINWTQYLKFSEERTAAREAAAKGGDGGGMMKKKGGWPQGGGDTKVVGSSSKPAEKTEEDLIKEAKEAFKKLDKNDDGFLDANERKRDEVLEAELAHWDKNMDDKIDLEEFTAYYLAQEKKRARQEKAQADSAAAASRIVIESDLERRTPVMRPGNYPKEMPAWFDKLDADKDGLVSLAEWRAADKSLNAFKEYDRNDDGFLSPEEVLRYESAKNGTPLPAQLLAGNTAGSSASAPQTPAVSQRPVAINWGDIFKGMRNKDGGQQGGKDWKGKKGP